MAYQHGNTRYEITVENPDGVSQGVCALELDGERLSHGKGVALQDDGQVHRVRVVLG